MNQFDTSRIDQLNTFDAMKGAHNQINGERKVGEGKEGRSSGAVTTAKAKKPFTPI